MMLSPNQLHEEYFNEPKIPKFFGPLESAPELNKQGWYGH